MRVVVGDNQRIEQFLKKKQTQFVSSDLMIEQQEHSQELEEDWRSTSANVADEDQHSSQSNTVINENNINNSISDSNFNMIYHNNSSNSSGLREQFREVIDDEDLRTEIERYSYDRRRPLRPLNQERQQYSLIQTASSSSRQMKHIICMGLSVTMLCGVALFLLRNNGKTVSIICFLLLTLSLILLFFKFQRVRQQQRQQIHENSHFSYALDEQNNFPRYEEFRSTRQARQSRTRERFLGQESQFLELILENMRQRLTQRNLIFQLDHSEGGFSEEQITTQIQGACSFSEHSQKLKEIKNDTMSDTNLKNELDTLHESSDQKIDDNDEPQCIICLDIYKSESQLRVLRCKHFFHQYCLDEWLKKKKECPVCRQSPLDVTNFSRQNNSDSSSIVDPLQLFTSPEMIIPMSPQLLLGIYSSSQMRRLDSISARRVRRARRSNSLNINEIIQNSRNSISDDSRQASRARELVEGIDFIVHS